MKCEEYLRRLSEETRERMEQSIAALLGKPLPLASALTGPVLRDLCAALSSLEKETLKTMMVHFGCRPFTEEELVTAAQWRISGAELKVGLIRLRQKGLVFALRKSWGESIYALPQDSFSLLQECLFPSLNVTRYAEETEVNVLHERTGDIVQDLFHVLVYAKDHSLALTKNKSVPRTILKPLSERIGLKEHHLEGLDVPVPDKPSLSLPVVLVLDMALKFGLLEEDSNRLIIHEQGLNDWLRSPAKALRQNIFRYWTEMFFPKEPWCQHALALLDKLPEHRWVFVEDLLEGVSLICGEEPNGETGQREERLFREWLLPFCGLGFLEIGELSPGRRLLRKTSGFPEGADDGRRSVRPLYVQPDLEIIAPPGTPLLVLWELTSIARPVDDGLIKRYRLDRESMRRALENGWSAEKIIRFLQKHAAAPVPDPVYAAVRDWADRFGSVVFAHAILLCCQRESLADEIAGDDRLKPFISWRAGPLCFVVKEDAAEEMRRALEKKGYIPLRKSGDCGSPDSESPEKGTCAANQEEGTEKDVADERKWRGFFRPRTDLNIYQPDPHLPDPETWLNSARSSLPSMWLKDFRGYHPSTQLELISTAIAWKTYVRLRMGGRVEKVLPVSLQENGKEWELTGWNGKGMIRLGQHQWEEMQLILPGINDNC